jgi:hypothetical protein
MKNFALKRFLVECGRYFEPAHLFYHRRIEEGLAGLGFSVLSIERLAKASAWQVKLRATLEVQAQIVGRTYRARNLNCAKTTKLLEGWLKAELRALLRQLGSGTKSDALVVVRRGAYFSVRFVWPFGTPGRWRPPTSPTHPFRVSGMIQDWLKQQRN